MALDHSTDEGKMLGKYLLAKRLAVGGMGEVYLAKLSGPVGFEKLVVIKTVREEFTHDQSFLDMFFAEARVVAQLNHPNITQVFEIGEYEGQYFIAMEYVHGQTLRDLIIKLRAAGKFLEPGHVVNIISQLCAGLSYAHNAADMYGDSLNIVHRDINPQNILIDYNGNVKVIDFGIAKSEVSDNKTSAGTIKGKYSYMSPEQSRAGELDKRSDLFAVGICLYETLMAKNPFMGANMIETLSAVQQGTFSPLAESDPALTPFDPILAKALAKNRDHRYADCNLMRKELLALLNEGTIPQSSCGLSTLMRQEFAKENAATKQMLAESSNSTRLPAPMATLQGSEKHTDQQLQIADMKDNGVVNPRLRIALIAIATFTGIGSVGAYKFAGHTKHPINETVAQYLGLPVVNRGTDDEVKK